MANVSVNISGAPYEVHVERGLLDRAGERVRALTAASRVAVVTDIRVAPLYLEPLRRSLSAAGLEPVDVTITAGEAHKTLATVEMIYDRLLDARIDRATPIVALGGGVVGDVAGFAAATILRGVPLVQVPTTLLAMVDASVGGKTGVNHLRGKNLIGAFHQPHAVLIDPNVLASLPAWQLSNGLAECIKHELIRDADGFARLEQGIERALSLDMNYLEELIAHNVAIKASVVEADPLERGERAHLNFGHTFAHAIESSMNYDIAHGRAVGLGIVAASYLSMRLGSVQQSEFERIRSLLARARLHTGGVQTPTEGLINAMRRDKKIQSGQLRFVLLDGIGRAVVRDDVPQDLVREALAMIR
jgi:3-dehydroquinate synthase